MLHYLSNVQLQSYSLRKITFWIQMLSWIHLTLLLKFKITLKRMSGRREKLEKQSIREKRERVPEEKENLLKGKGRRKVATFPKGKENLLKGKGRRKVATFPKG